MPQAFWTLAYFVEALLPDYFGSLSGAMVDMQVVDWLLKEVYALPAPTLRPLSPPHVPLGCLTAGPWLVSI